MYFLVVVLFLCMCESLFNCYNDLSLILVFNLCSNVFKSTSMFNINLIILACVIYLFIWSKGLNIGHKRLYFLKNINIVIFNIKYNGICISNGI